MKTRQSLIRYHEWQVDERRKVLAELYAAANAIDRDEERLNVMASIEQVKAAEDEVGRISYPAFLEGLKLRRANLAQSRTELEAQIDAAQEALQLAFQELKKIEIMEERRKERERKALAAREMAELDEIASQRHSRNGTDI